MHARPAPRRPRPKSTARAVALGTTAALLGTSAPVATAEARQRKSRLDKTEKRTIRQVNRVRARHGLRPYRPSRALSRSADYHSRDMARGNFLAHSSSNGTSFEGRVRRYTRAGRIGENLAWVQGLRPGDMPHRVVQIWLRSPSHRAALLSREFTRIGLARRTGRVGAARTTFFTADLATG